MSSDEEDMRSDEEEQEDVDDFSEEEEETPKKRKSAAAAPKKKKAKKPKVMSFIDDMADEASDDESDEEDYDRGDFLPDERRLAEEEKEELDHQSHHQYARQRNAYNDDDTEEYIKQLQKRAKQQNRRGNDDDEEDNVESMQSAVAQQSLLPSIQDPRLWVFKCKPGREQHLVMSLMNKFLELAKRGQPMHIKSVVASSSKGFIYVESEREPYAKDAVNGIRDIFPWSMKLVPIHEMTAVLTIQSKKTPVTAGCWARFKRAGLYKGDLCKVVEIVDNGLRAVVKHIPRLDQAVLNGGEQPKYKKGQRPPLKLFNPSSVQGHHEITRKRHTLTNEMMDFFDNEWFKDGFQYKELNIATMLQLDEVNPTLDEINKFSHSTTEVDSDNEPTSVSKLDLGDADAWKNKVDLTKGDTVKVIEGDLINLLGIVVGTNSNNDTVRVMPLHEEIKDTILDFQLKQLVKVVKIGAHIKVVSGRYSGETGTVVSIDESLGAPVAIVLVDSQAKEIQVRVRDIQESAEVSQGLDSLKGKELYDLVMLPHGEVGVITHVGRDSFTVLAQNGQTKTIADQEIQRKMFSSRASALDKKGSPITVGEMVQVVDGPFSGQTGTIKHIYRSFIFLHNNRVTMNAGIFMVRNRQLVVAGDKIKSNAPSAVGGPGGPNDRRDQRQQGRGPPRGMQSDLVGKTVKIKRGQWKGYIGIVVDEADNTVKVEIHCKSKCVEIEKKFVNVAGDRQGVHVDRTHGSSSTMGSNTSATPMVSATPLHHGMTPMATPLHAPRTPSRSSGGYSSGGRTPRDAWSSQNDDTLFEQHNIPQEKEISHAQSFGTPLEPVVPSEFGVASTYKTASSSSYNDMHSIMNHPTTPGLLNPTTPGFQGSYSTPGLQPTTPFVSTPGMPRNSSQTPLQTPFQGHNSFGPTTPGINMMHHPTTPGIMNPTTPGFAAYTPMNPTTPGLFAKGTPAATTPHMGSLATPAPMTPAGGGFYDSGFGSTSSSNERSWMSKGVVVEVTASGEFYQAEGIIVSVGHDTCTLDIRGQMVNIHFDGMNYVIPEKQDNVKILVGDEAGKTGSLIGTDPPDGIVKMDGTAEIKIYPLSHLAKLAT
ncbi:Aste57867_20293 [Aphanomyces stellatus]|uniref:Transcription elongation factor SPT5 n=1 Tax=Aphanomyces stellatus TaxID=120398 RepID=A0A485LFD1_9STRA|nr:hypothetical protein As57867_020227 [Aphanomyces stellatus]VFT96983.1 Aste57867_20293 [Aphanomyces stellatus]